MESRDIVGISYGFGEACFVLKDGGVMGASKMAVSLYEEVRALRFYGNKDCTAAADEALDKKRLATVSTGRPAAKKEEGNDRM
jgi:hypothetical protein